MQHILLIQPLFFDSLKETPLASQFRGLNRYYMKACAAPWVPQISPPQKKMLQKEVWRGEIPHLQRGWGDVHCRNRRRYDNESDSFRTGIESHFIIKLSRLKTWWGLSVLVRTAVQGISTGSVSVGVTVFLSRFLWKREETRVATEKYSFPGGLC